MNRRSLENYAGVDPQNALVCAGSKSERDPQTHAIIGAAMQVRRRLGSGFLEAASQDALEIEFSSQGIPAAREVALPMYYKAQRLACSYRADFIYFDCVAVELKAIHAWSGIEDAQLLNYLRATRLERGPLFSFARPSLESKRFVFSNLRESAQSAD